MLSLAVHATLLAVRFAASQAFDVKRADLGLEVVLVNAKSAVAPRTPTALAQANLNGGGEFDQQRATTPLPAMAQEQAGDAVRQVQRQIQQIEQEQQRLLTQRMAAAAVDPARPQVHPRSDPREHGVDDRTTLDEIARLEAEIARNLEHYGKRPKRHQLTAASTQEVVYAQYYDALRRKIEARGTLQFPQRDGQPLYGDLILVINVNQAGQLGYQRDGYLAEGVEVVKSSGDVALDRQAVAIVRAAAPFGRFTSEMAMRYDILEIVSTFRFSRSGLETRLQPKSP
jgi:protein TonB